MKGEPLTEELFDREAFEKHLNLRPVTSTKSKIASAEVTKSQLLNDVLDGVAQSIIWEGELVCGDAFSWRKSIKEVNLPNAKVIESHAFNECISLETVVMNSVDTLGDGVFKECARLKTLVIGNEESVAMRGESLFEGCDVFVGSEDHTINKTGEKLGLVFVPDELVEDYMKSSMWEDVSEQIAPLSQFERETKITLTEENEAYDDFFGPQLTNFSCDKTRLSCGALAGKLGLESLNLPNLEYVSENNFRACIELKSIDLPKVRAVGRKAFQDCLSLREANLPSAEILEAHSFRKCPFANASFEEAGCVGDSAFFKCRKLESISLPKATYIGARAFAHCKVLKQVDVSQARVLGNHAFYDCESLECINLPNVVEIGELSFAGCHSLRKVVLGNKTGVVKMEKGGLILACHFSGDGIDEHNPESKRDGVFYVPDELLKEYRIDDSFITFADLIRPISDLNKDVEDESSC